jgi:hypothetical protein
MGDYSEECADAAAAITVACSLSGRAGPFGVTLGANRSDPSNYSASRQEPTGRGISPLHQRCKLKSSYLPFVPRSGRVSSKDPTHFPIDHFALAPPLFKRMLKLLGHEISHFSAELTRKH